MNRQPIVLKALSGLMPLGRIALLLLLGLYVGLFLSDLLAVGKDMRCRVMVLAVMC